MPASRALLLIPLLLAGASAARADSLGLDPSNFPDPNALLDAVPLKTLIKTVGSVTANRPYEPATPLAVSTATGLDIGVSLTAVKVPESFGQALTTVGAKASAAPPLAPFPQLQFHKSLGPRADIGGFWVGYRGYTAYGGDLKGVIWMPEEGPTWALRLCYSHARIAFFSTNTFTPQLVVSRKLEFADPYIGAGMDIIKGSVTISTSSFGLPIDESLTGNANAVAGNAFLGVSLRVPELGFRLTLEGSYSSLGAHTMGAKFSLSI